mmetsp:Transcript_19765/g.48625  ORF Transcript_19765/g.48625 Transcript_19765/m.48625 type:complete len:664 (+) Transcript_19765:159-2150(+)
MHRTNAPAAPAAAPSVASRVRPVVPNLTLTVPNEAEEAQDPQLRVEDELSEDWLADILNNESPNTLARIVSGNRFSPGKAGVAAPAGLSPHRTGGDGSGGGSSSKEEIDAECDSPRGIEDEVSGRSRGSGGWPIAPAAAALPAYPAPERLPLEHRVLGTSMLPQGHQGGTAAYEGLLTPAAAVPIQRASPFVLEDAPVNRTERFASSQPTPSPDMSRQVGSAEAAARDKPPASLAAAAYTVMLDDGIGSLEHLCLDTSAGNVASPGPSFKRRRVLSHTTTADLVRPLLVVGGDAEDPQQHLQTGPLHGNAEGRVPLARSVSMPACLPSPSFAGDTAEASAEASCLVATPRSAGLPCLAAAVSMPGSRGAAHEYKARHAPPAAPTQAGIGVYLPPPQLPGYATAIASPLPTPHLTTSVVGGPAAFAQPYAREGGGSGTVATARVSGQHLLHVQQPVCAVATPLAPVQMPPQERHLDPWPSAGSFQRQPSVPACHATSSSAATGALPPAPHRGVPVPAASAPPSHPPMLTPLPSLTPHRNSDAEDRKAVALTFAPNEEEAMRLVELRKTPLTGDDARTNHRRYCQGCGNPIRGHKRASTHSRCSEVNCWCGLAKNLHPFFLPAGPNCRAEWRRPPPKSATPPPLSTPSSGAAALYEYGHPPGPAD